MKKEKEVDKVLRKNTLKCPQCNQLLHFEQIHGIRLISDGLYSAFCPNDNIYYKVRAGK